MANLDRAKQGRRFWRNPFRIWRSTREIENPSPEDLGHRLHLAYFMSSHSREKATTLRRLRPPIFESPAQYERISRSLMKLIEV